MNFNQNNSINLIFPVYGTILPAEHNYRLYSCLCRWNKQIKQKNWQIKTINGYPDRQGKIYLGKDSRMAIRCCVKDLALWLDLQQTELEVDGHGFKLGNAEISMLNNSQSLRSRIVTIKHNGQTANLSKLQFRDCLLFKLFKFGIRCDIDIGEKRKIIVSRKPVYGYGVKLNSLQIEDSIAIQSCGIGGRRRMGCGYFE